MKFFIVLALASVVAAEPLWYSSHFGTGSPVAPLVANPWTGTITPDKTPAVKAAEIQHFASKPYIYGAIHHPIYKREADAQLAYHHYMPYLSAHAKTNALVAHPYSGAVVPDDTVSVKAAKAQHFAAKAFDYATKPYYGLYNYGAAHVLYKREAEPQHYSHYMPYTHVAHAKSPALVAHPYSGAVVPDDTASVKAAKAQHFAAKAAQSLITPQYYGKVIHPGQVYHTLLKRDAESQMYGYGLPAYNQAYTTYGGVYNNYYRPYSYGSYYY